MVSFRLFSRVKRNLRGYLFDIRSLTTRNPEPVSNIGVSSKFHFSGQAFKRMTAHLEVSSLFRRRGFRGLVRCVATLTLLAAFSLPSNAQEKPTPDVVLMKNGDQVTGKLERSVGTDLIFKSDILGEVTIPMDKVKELR